MDTEEAKLTVGDGTYSLPPGGVDVPDDAERYVFRKISNSSCQSTSLQHIKIEIVTSPLPKKKRLDYLLMNTLTSIAVLCFQLK